LITTKKIFVCANKTIEKTPLSHNWITISHLEKSLEHTKGTNVNLSEANITNSLYSKQEQKDVTYLANQNEYVEKGYFDNKIQLKEQYLTNLIIKDLLQMMKDHMEDYNETVDNNSMMQSKSNMFNITINAPNEKTSQIVIPDSMKYGPKKNFLDITKNDLKTDLNKLANESKDSFYKIVDGQKPSQKRLSIRNEALVASRLQRKSTVEKKSTQQSSDSLSKRNEVQNTEADDNNITEDNYMDVVPSLVKFYPSF